MSISIDLISQYLLDERIKTLGSVTGDIRTLDISGITGQLPASLNIPTSSIIEISGAGGAEGRSQTSTWLEVDLVKSPPNILTAGETGITRKRQDFVIMIKSLIDSGKYLCQAISDEIEGHFPNNLHLTHGDHLLTVMKTYQQANIYLDSNSGRYWNRIYVECETFYDNKK